MADRWLCLIDGQKIGPVKFSRLKQLAEAGRLRAHDYVRPEEQEQWSSAHEIADLIPAPAVTPETSESKPTEPGAEKRRNSGSLPVATVLIQDEVTVSLPSARKGTPVGKAVAATPPVGKPVAPPKQSKESESASEFPLFVAKDDASHAGANGEASHAHGRKTKKSNVMPLMIGGGVVVGVLGLVLVLVLSGVIDLSGSSEEVAATPAKKPKPAVDTPAEDETEANPDDAESQDAKAADKPAKKGDGKHPLLKTVERFNDITKGSPKLRGSGIKVGVTGLWLSSSEAGTPAAGSETPKYLVVKVKIDNPAGGAPMDYKGWGDEAVLFDEADKAIQPLPADKTPDQTAKQKIAPGSSLVDTLVFPLESVEFETLRLALPHETIGVKGSKSFGLELPRHALGRGLDTQVAGGADPAISARKTAGEEEEDIIEKPPVANSTPTPMPVKPAAKPKDDDEEIIRKLEEKAKLLDKMDKEKPKK